MRIYKIDKDQFVEKFTEIAKILAYHRDEFFYIPDMDEANYKRYIIQNLKIPLFYQAYTTRRIDRRTDQIIFTSEIEKLQLFNIVSDYSHTAAVAHDPFVIHADKSLFWSKLKLALAKYKKIKCYDRALSNDLRSPDRRNLQFQTHGPAYTESMKLIKSILDPALGAEWEINICINHGAVPNGVNFEAPLSDNFKILTYRKLPHDRIWADMSDVFLFASSIGLQISDKSVIYYPLTPNIQSQQSILVAF